MDCIVGKYIDKVPQIHTVFTNVSKGQPAKKEELMKAFGKVEATEVCKEIQAKGNLQTSEKERANMIALTFNSVAPNVASFFQKQVVRFKGKECPKLKENLMKLASSAVKGDWEGHTLSLVIWNDPGHLRQMNEMVRNDTKGKGKRNS